LLSSRWKSSGTGRGSRSPKNSRCGDRGGQGCPLPRTAWHGACPLAGVEMMSHMHDQQHIDAALRRIRSLRRWLASVLLTYLPMSLLCYIFRIPAWIFLTACAIWVFLGVVIALRIGYSICPVCRQYFHVRGMEGDTFSRECVNCGIRLNQDG
jgi:hypothetical protein